MNLFAKLILFTAFSFKLQAQTVKPTPPVTKAETKAATTVEVDSKEAFLNVSYKFKDRKMMVFVDDAGVSALAFIEATSSALTADTYTISSLDGKTVIATYTVEREGNKVTMAYGKNVKTFDLTAYLAKCSSNLEKDAVKRKHPVYWLFKNGYAKN